MNMSNNGDELNAKFAIWRLKVSSSTTSLDVPAGPSTSTSSVGTVLSRQSSRTNLFQQQPQKKRKFGETDEYKVIPDEAFPTFRELRKVATREAKVENHLRFLIRSKEDNTIPIGLRVNLKPAFGQNEPAFMESWNKTCLDCSNQLIVLLGDRASAELDTLNPQVAEKRAEMLSKIPDEEQKKKALNYLQEVLKKEAPDTLQKKAGNVPPRRPRYQNQPSGRQQRGPYRPNRNRPTESEEDLLYIMRSLKNRRNRRR